jgi:hypothetical protein
LGVTVIKKVFQRIWGSGGIWKTFGTLRSHAQGGICIVSPSIILLFYVGGNMAVNEEDKIIAFGMTSRQISETAEALSKIKDNNHPKKTSSYMDFLAVKNYGHEKILTQENYGKIS